MPNEVVDLVFKGLVRGFRVVIIESHSEGELCDGGRRRAVKVVGAGVCVSWVAFELFLPPDRVHVELEAQGGIWWSAGEWLRLLPV